MSQTSITTHLSSSSIRSTIAKLRAYKDDLAGRCSEFRSRVADLLVNEVQNGFAGTIVEEFWPYSGKSKAKVRREASVTVTSQESGDITLVIASGPDAVWVEFGTGVFYNTAVGTSPHPWVSENDLPFRIGTYGWGNGARKVWFYTDEDTGKRMATHGIKAQMPMFHAVSAVSEQIVAIAKEVFGYD